MGTGQVSGYVSGTEFTGNFGEAVLNGMTGNDSLNVPQDLEIAAWGLNYNADIESSEIIEHLTVKATGDGTNDYYSFDVTDAMISGGAISAIFDIDYGFDYLGGKYDSVWWSGTIRLFDPDGNVIGYNDYTDPGIGGAGSTTWLDPYVSTGLNEAGTYIIEIANSWWWLGTSGVPQGADYELQVSVENHDIGTFTFEPSPIYENETANNTAQSITDSDTWYVYFNQDIGNTAYPGGLVDYNTSYTTVIGDGDGSWDKYEFVITDAMLNPVAGTIGGATDTRAYYLDASIDLDAPGDLVAVGDIWTIRLNGESYTHTVQAGDDLSDVISNLVTKIGLDTDTFDTYTAAADATDTSVIDIADVNGVRIDGVTQEIQVAGSVTRTEDTNNVSFTDAAVQLILGGAAVAPGDTWTILLDDAPYSYTAADGDTLENVRDGLFAALPAAGYSKALTGTDTITFAKAGGFTLDFAQTGISPRDRAVITGTPVAATAESILWDEVVFDLTGTIHHNQKWTLTLNQNSTIATAEYTAGKDDTLSDIVDGLNSDEPSGYIFTTDDESLTVRRTDGKAFTASLDITVAPVTGSCSVSGTPSHYSTAKIELTGPVHEGETWTITLTGTDGTATPYAYEAADFNTDGNVNADDVGAGLAAMSAALTYDAGTNTLTVTDAAGVAVALDITQTAIVQGSMAIDGSNSTRAVTVADIDLSSTAVDAKNEDWVLTLNGVDYTYTTTDSPDLDTKDDVGAAFADDTDISDAGFTVSYVAGTDILTVTRPDSSAFTYAFALDGSGSPDFSETQSPDQYAEAEIDLTDDVITGEAWTVTLSDGTDTITATATVGDDDPYGTGTINQLSDIARYLREELEGDYDISQSGSTLTISRDDGTPFTVTYDIAPAPVTGGMAIDEAASTVSHWTSADMALSGSVSKDETWTLTITALDGTETTYGYDATDRDSDGDVDRDDVGAGLADQDAALFYNSTTNILTVTDANGVAVALSITPAPVEGDAALSGTLIPTGLRRSYSTGPWLTETNGPSS